jgi:hypothetical protein
MTTERAGLLLRVLSARAALSHGTRGQGAQNKKTSGGNGHAAADDIGHMQRECGLEEPGAADGTGQFRIQSLVNLAAHPVRVREFVGAEPGDLLGEARRRCDRLCDRGMGDHAAPGRPTAA